MTQRGRNNKGTTPTKRTYNNIKKDKETVILTPSFALIPFILVLCYSFIILNLIEIWIFTNVEKVQNVSHTKIA